MQKTAQARCLEAERGKSIEQMVREAIEQGRTWEDLALDLGITRFTLREWCRRLGIRVETRHSVSFRSEELASASQEDYTVAMP
jgi:transposase-like protein